MRPFALEITVSDFAFAAGHRPTAISLLTPEFRRLGPQRMARGIIVGSPNH
jgi:hypothetical protein